MSSLISNYALWSDAMPIILIFVGLIFACLTFNLITCVRGWLVVKDTLMPFQCSGATISKALLAAGLAIDWTNAMQLSKSLHTEAWRVSYAIALLNFLTILLSSNYFVHSCEQSELEELSASGKCRRTFAPTNRTSKPTIIIFNTLNLKIININFSVRLDF